MTSLEALQLSKEQLSQQLSTLTASPRPSYSVGDRTMNWPEYQRCLLDAIERLTVLIQSESGPVEYVTQGLL